VTVMVFDIDDFKTYNDQYGHEAGDDILREAVRLLRSVIRPSDRVCRIGGDEFAVISYEPSGPRQEGSVESAAGRLRRVRHARAGRGSGYRPLRRKGGVERRAASRLPPFITPHIS